jgi:hypothetical protein
LKRRFRSEHGSWLNCTPLKGPLVASTSPGLKCDCTIWLAVRVLNALPSLERYAPVTAFAIAASVEGMMLMFSSPPLMPLFDEMVTVIAAPFIANTASTLPTRSTTAMVAPALRLCASATPRAITFCTSSTVRNVELDAQDPSHCGVPAATAGPGWLVSPEPPLQETSTGRQIARTTTAACGKLRGRINPSVSLFCAAMLCAAATARNPSATADAAVSTLRRNVRAEGVTSSRPQLDANNQVRFLLRFWCSRLCGRFE